MISVMQGRGNDRRRASKNGAVSGFGQLQG
jgi:hypothetical protein